MRPYGTGTVEQCRGKFRSRGPALPDKTRPVIGVFDSEEEAHRACDAYALVLAQAKVTMTLRQWGERYLDRRELDQKKRNIRTDRNRWKLHVATSPFADWPLCNIQRRDIKDWLAKLGHVDAQDVKARDPEKRKTTYRRKPRKLSAQTRKHCLNLLRKALDEAVDDELIPSNPAAGVEPPKIGELEFDYLTYEEQLKIERCGADEADILRAKFAWGTGIRQFDQWALKLTDLRLDRTDPDMVFWCHKLEKRVRVPLFGPALDAITRWLALLPEYATENKLGLVFPTPSGCQRQKSKNYGWHKLLAKAGVARPVKWHELRDTCATSLLSGWWGRAWRLEEVKEMLVHSSIEVTERYARLAPAALAQAARETRIAPGRTAEPPQRDICHQSATAALTPSEASQPNLPARHVGLEPTIFGSGGRADREWLRELAGLRGRLMADSMAVIRAQATGDPSAARLALALAEAVLRVCQLELTKEGAA